MPFERVTQEKLSIGIARQIEDLILRGILRPGQRLPSERELSERMEVSRPSLREALADLQHRGLLTARAGAGVYVADVLGSAFAPALIDLFADHPVALFDTISFRRDMEGLAAVRATKHGTDTDLAVIDTIFKKMEAAHRKADPTDEAQLDADFHLAIIEASHNIILLHMMRSMYDLLRQGVFYNRAVMFQQRLTRGDLVGQHRAINVAIQNRDAAGAQAAINAHLDYVQHALEDQQTAIQNEGFARKRLDIERQR
ncbi:MAG: FCD domain-containing protein [Alphaproteobacteria bacterium]|jgi:GntR family transcriptional repressor for pyruvate dehydrogenase complex|uniref:Pyruvate dehydrogenase complex repressor n=1 Tax=Loktanella salsilacus TaxID=195913 RepID=A0A1I4DF20_9RHOB|nr:FCD domain-containing protein [Loktanella salsilacus]MBU0779742.1 FCD domain-containing protein [Alphaproteobacteria bacterium]MBU0862162.1 FCD domain-containing protein [Alphaproteobacteria bacterium]MBU1836374.1 FCD domain-containing protein [Alphaproteobacteria bacterium]UTH47920.1 FCD domain-containing protein [Loktanella salsilacus]SFK92238.1 transcriptional regulator, GntR family [Loktanella salsilacus]|tara:strand:+ start:1328 stop:2095 length:768 start_codon:yes stop_codon:yes gene_type:complete